MVILILQYAWDINHHCRCIITSIVLEAPQHPLETCMYKVPPYPERRRAAHAKVNCELLFSVTYARKKPPNMDGYGETVRF